MKILGSTIFRSLMSLCVGLLLLSNASVMGPLIVQVIGGFFLLSGVVGVAAWVFDRMRSSVKPFFPIGSVGCILLGVVPVLMPQAFVTYLVALLGILLVMAGISQLGAQISYRRVAPVSIFGLILPIAILAVGLYIVIKPLESVATCFQILGAAITVYAITDLFLALRLRHYNRIFERKQKEEERRRQREIEASYVTFEVVDATAEKEQETSSDESKEEPAAENDPE